MKKLLHAGTFSLFLTCTLTAPVQATDYTPIFLRLIEEATPAATNWGKDALLVLKRFKLISKEFLSDLDHTKLQLNTTNKVNLDWNEKSPVTIKFDFNAPVFLRLGTAVCAMGAFFTALGLGYYALTRDLPTNRKTVLASCSGVGMVLAALWLYTIRHETPSGIN